MTQLNVRIRKIHPNAVVPAYATEGAAGFDLVAVEDAIIAPGETALVRTGLAFEIPAGYEVQIRPRSGISSRTKLRIANAPGTIDSDFRGEVAVIVDNVAPLRFGGHMSVGVDTCCTYETLDGNRVTTENVRSYRYSYANDEYYEEGPRRVPVGTYVIRAGDRIAQGIIAPVKRATFEITDELTETARGAGGFGSTGISG
jgi:dUTP pyrophosphatase